MQLKGHFEASSLASILQMLHNDAKTGELKLTQGGKAVVIYLRDGNVICASTNEQGLRVGTLLRSKGIISAKDLQECLVVGKKKGQALGAVLVEREHITTDVLKKVLAKQAEGVIYNMFLWERGAFEYNDGVEPSDGVIEASLDIMGIILEATRRIDEMRVLKKHIPADNVVFRISDRFADKDKLKFNAIEWRFLSLIDGTRTVRQLINESGYEDFAVYKVLNSLISFGLIERGEEVSLGDAEWVSGYSAIVSVYCDILQEILRFFSRDLGGRPYIILWGPAGKPEPLEPGILKAMRMAHVGIQKEALLKRAKPEIDPPEKDIFRTFDPDSPMDVYIHVVLEIVGDIPDVEQGRRFLASSFNRFVFNLLKEVHPLLGNRATREILREITRILRYVQKYQKNLSEKTNITKDVEKILRTIDVRIRNGGKERKSPRGLATILPDRLPAFKAEEEPLSVEEEPDSFDLFIESGGKGPIRAPVFPQAEVVEAAVVEAAPARPEPAVDHGDAFGAGEDFAFEEPEVLIPEEGEADDDEITAHFKSEPGDALGDMDDLDADDVLGAPLKEAGGDSLDDEPDSLFEDTGGDSLDDEPDSLFEDTGGDFEGAGEIRDFDDWDRLEMENPDLNSEGKPVAKSGAPKAPGPAPGPSAGSSAREPMDLDLDDDDFILEAPEEDEKPRASAPGKLDEPESDPLADLEQILELEDDEF